LPGGAAVGGQPLIDALRGGTMVFAYYPDQDWLKHRSCWAASGCVGLSPRGDARRRAAMQCADEHRLLLHKSR
jgi:hypothetical protein